MNASLCVPCCGEPVITEIPGAAGLQGPPGAEGEKGEQGEPGVTPELLDFTDYNSPAYEVTATPTQITGVSRVLGDAGRYLIMARATFLSNGSTFAANRTVTSYLYNASTSANISNSTKVIGTGIKTTATETLPHYGACVIYEAAGDNEVIQMFTSIDVVPTVSPLLCNEAEIVAIRLGD